MASCVRNICAKNYQNLIIGFQDTVENVGDVFFGTQCSSLCRDSYYKSFQKTRSKVIYLAWM